MASTYSMRFRLNYQAAGDNLNLWGLILNAGVFQLLEDAIAGRLAFTLSGTKILTTVNGATDEARKAFLDITGGTGGTVTVPSTEKIYLVRNGASGDVVLTTGAGVTATLSPTEITLVVCDGTNVRPVGFNGLGWKDYIASVAFDASGALPAQAGNAGKFVRTDGANASWQAPLTTDIPDYAAQTNKRALRYAMLF